MLTPQERLLGLIEKAYLTTTDEGGGPYHLARVEGVEVDELDPDKVYRAGYFAGFTNALQMVGAVPRASQTAIRDALLIKDQLRRERDVG